MRSNDAFRELLNHSLGFQKALAIMGYRMGIAQLRPLCQDLFDRISFARGQKEQLESIVADWTLAELQEAIDGDERRGRILWEAAAHKSIYEDAAAILMLVFAGQMERLYQEIGVSLFSRGSLSYVPSITVTRAVQALANQYKHLGEWSIKPKQDRADRIIVEGLVGDPLRSDAAAEFLRKSSFKTYKELQDAMISASFGLDEEGIIVDDHTGLRNVVMVTSPEKAPCPRRNASGGSVCEHGARFHDEQGVCSQCQDGAAAFRPCARPRAL